MSKSLLLQTRTTAVTPQSYEPLAFEIIPSRTHDPDQTEATLHAAMQGLVLDKKRPIALEITGIGASASKQFVIRAKDLGALEHARTHIQAYAPQVAIRQITASDPLCPLPSETVSVYELRPGAASYLPMRDMEETDPVRGILAALSLPPDMRATAQIALIPATPAWSRGNLRRAVEHPLEKERLQQRMMIASRGAPSTAGIIFLGIVLLLLLLYIRFQDAIPVWFFQAVTSLFFQGTIPQLPFGEALLFYGSLFTVLAGLLVLALGAGWLKTHLFGGPALYDQREVARKTGQMAYQACIHLYVFGPGPYRSLRQLVRRYTPLLVASTLRHARQFTHKKQTKRLKPTHPDLILRRAWQHFKPESDWRRFQKQRRVQVLDRITAAYRQFDTASAGYFVKSKISDRSALRCALGQWSKKVTRSRHFITADFLSRAWYLPKASMFELPGIEQKRARTLLMPTELIAQGLQSIIGTSEHSGYAFPFALPAGFFGQHTLIGGKTGEGKSTLMIHIAREACRSGALCVIDPHGDLAHDVLRSIPADRHDDVVFVDLGDAVYSVGLNPLDATTGRDRDLVVAALVDAFRNIWESGWGTRMEAPFRAALMTLFEANEMLVKEGKATEQYTILDIVQLLLDESFCQNILKYARDIYLHRFWFLYYETLAGRQQRERIDPVITKMLQFESRVARRILGQPQSTIDLSRMVRERQILVLRLATSEAGLAAPVLGATVLSLLMVALREQSVLPPDLRVGMSIIVDEFQSIPGADYAQLLAELRKFGGAAVLATQSFEYLAKLSPHLQATTMANVKQYFMFRLSADDARLIARELGDVTEEDILNLDQHTCYVKLIHQMRQQPAFSLRIHLPDMADRTVIDLIRSRSRRFARESRLVEDDLTLALTRALQAHPQDKKKAAPKGNTVSSSHVHQVEDQNGTPTVKENTDSPPNKQGTQKGARSKFDKRRSHLSNMDVDA